MHPASRRNRISVIRFIPFCVPCSKTITDGFETEDVEDSADAGVVTWLSAVSVVVTATKVVVSVASGTAVVGNVEVISSSGGTVTGFSGTATESRY